MYLANDIPFTLIPELILPYYYDFCKAYDNDNKVVGITWLR